MYFDWDGENERHIGRHAISVEEFEEAFQDPHKVPGQLRKVEYERRVAMLGRTDAGRLLHFVYTVRGQAVRPVSARDATFAERRRYRR